MAKTSMLGWCGDEVGKLKSIVFGVVRILFNHV